jgi:coenzyme F420-reducing hydrogenase delta subunit
VKELRAAHPEQGLVLIECGNAPFAVASHPRLSNLGRQIHTKSMDCVGQLHPAVVAALLKHFSGVAILGCPPGGCQMREGPELLENRLLHGRNPAHEEKLDKNRICIIDTKAGDPRESLNDLLAFVDRLRGQPGSSQKTSNTRRLVTLALTAGVGLALTAALSRVPATWGRSDPLLRLSWRIVAPVETTCRRLTDAELQGLPAHMRNPQKCEAVTFPVKWSIRMDGAEIAAAEEKTQGVGGQTVIFIDRDLVIPAGRHHFEATLEALGGSTAGKPDTHVFDAELAPSQAVLLTYNRAANGFVHRLPDF